MPNKVHVVRFEHGEYSTHVEGVLSTHRTKEGAERAAEKHRDLECGRHFSGITVWVDVFELED